MSALGGSAPYYEKDGALRAYANRAWILCGILVVAVVVLSAIVLVTRSKPPVIIRVGPDGEARVISPEGTSGVSKRTIESVKASQAPTELEKKNFVISFVNTYWSYDEHTLPDHWSKALNMMTRSLSKDVYGKMTAEATVGTLQAEHDKVDMTITNVEEDQADQLVFHVLATRVEIMAKDAKSYAGTKTAESYTIHLVETDRSIQNPAGLLVSGFKRDVISTEPYLVDQQ
jgi:VirB8 protein